MQNIPVNVPLKRGRTLIGVVAVTRDVTGASYASIVEAGGAFDAHARSVARAAIDLEDLNDLPTAEGAGQ